MNIPCQLNFPNVKIGRSPFTVSRYGCVVCSLSMLSELFGCFQDVPTVAGRDWYDAMGQLMWERIKFQTFRFVQRVRVRNDSVVRAALADPNGGVMLNVFKGKHWMMALKPVDTKRGTDFLCFDPLSGRTVLAMAAYGSITGSAMFERVI